MYISEPRINAVVKRTVGTGGVARGDLCVMSSNTAVKAAAAPTDGTVFGIALEDKSAGEVGKFMPVSDCVIAAKYTGSSKTSLTDADLGKAFDLSDEQTVNLDDTTGGFCVCEGYDNDKDLIFFKVLLTKRQV